MKKEGGVLWLFCSKTGSVDRPIANCKLPHMHIWAHTSAAVGDRGCCRHLNPLPYHYNRTLPRHNNNNNSKGACQILHSRFLSFTHTPFTENPKKQHYFLRRNSLSLAFTLLSIPARSPQTLDNYLLLLLLLLHLQPCLAQLSFFQVSENYL